MPSLRICNFQSRCQKTKRDGKQCGARALTGRKFCALHAEPGAAAALGRKGGRRRAVQVDDVHGESASLGLPITAEGVRDLLAEAIAQVRRRKLDTKVGNGLAYLAASLLRAIELSDVENRLRALEERNGS
jgi:hypothetical protein